MVRILNNPRQDRTPPLIVIVDDDRRGASYLGRLLEKSGYHTALHHCGEDALASLAGDDDPPALVVLDVDMPGMTGLECLRAIQADARLAGVPVIVYSGDFTYERMAEARELGAREYVVKGTMHWPHFLSLIRRHAGGREAEPAPAGLTPE